jgi:hypothetical protein
MGGKEEVQEGEAVQEEGKVRIQNAAGDPEVVDEHEGDEEDVHEGDEEEDVHEGEEVGEEVGEVRLDRTAKPRPDQIQHHLHEDSHWNVPETHPKCYSCRDAGDPK